MNLGWVLLIAAVVCLCVPRARAAGYALLVLFVAGLIVLTGLTFSAAASTTWPRHCASLSDYRQVKIGMTRLKVAEIMGHWGRDDADGEVAGYPAQERFYKTCNPRAFYLVDFDESGGQHLRYRVDNKRRQHAQ